MIKKKRFNVDFSLLPIQYSVPLNCRTYSYYPLHTCNVKKIEENTKVKRNGYSLYGWKTRPRNTRIYFRQILESQGYNK